MEEWSQSKLEEFIYDEIEESDTLEYKAADALSRSDKKKREITKDVSAMANANGGIIIYGISEFQDPPKEHLPEKIDPVIRSDFSKEWLEHITSNIQPRIPDLKIEPVPINKNPNYVVYVVEVPKGETAHQAQDYRYYRRYNFESVPMRDYEIRDVMQRRTLPDAQIRFKTTLYSSDSLYCLDIFISNNGDQLIHNFKVEFTFPKLGEIIASKIDSYYPPNPIGETGFTKTMLPHFSRKGDNKNHLITYYSREVLFPNDSVNIGEEVGFVYKIVFAKAIGNLKPTWNLYADNMPSKQGELLLRELYEARR